jgi:hypothetical protein
VSGSGSVNNISWRDTCITNNLSDEEIQYYRKQKQLLQQRNAGQNRIHTVLQDLETKMSVCKQKLLKINSSRSQSLIATVDCMIEYRKQLSDDFNHIQIPSQIELDDFTQKLSKLDEAVGKMQLQCEALEEAIHIDKLFTDLAVKASAYKQRVPIRSSNAQSLMNSIDSIIQEIAHLSDVFNSLETLSQESLHDFIQGIDRLDKVIDALKPNIEEARKSTHSGWWG